MGTPRRDGDAQLAEVEGVVPREASVREATNEAATAVGARELPPQTWEERTEPDCGTSAYRDLQRRRRTENESAC